MEALTIRAVPSASLVDILSVLEREKTDTSAGANGAVDACNSRSQGYTVYEGDKLIMAYVLTFENSSKKRVCWVVGGRGRAPGHDLTAEVLPFVERQAREGGAQQIAITTKRRGLEKKITAMGFNETGRIYRKNLTWAA